MKILQLFIYAIIYLLASCQSGKVETESTKQESNEQKKTSQYSTPGSITLTTKNVSLSEVLRSIRSQSDYKFAFNSDLDTIKVTIDVKNESVLNVLQMLVKNYPIKYKVRCDVFTYIGVHVKK